MEWNMKANNGNNHREKNKKIKIIILDCSKCAFCVDLGTSSQKLIRSHISTNLIITPALEKCVIQFTVLCVGSFGQKALSNQSTIDNCLLCFSVQAVDQNVEMGI